MDTQACAELVNCCSLTCYEDATSKIMHSVKFSGEMEGRRERKRRETRARIADAALTLFRERGFAAVTVDEIAEAADVSKRTFFDYFPAKEDVVSAWQDRFSALLSDEVAARPAGEPLRLVIEQAMLKALSGASTPEAAEIAALIHKTPALAARNQMKYVKLEKVLTAGLIAREPMLDPLQARLIATFVIGALRVGSETWQVDADSISREIGHYARGMFEAVWEALDRLR